MAQNTTSQLGASAVAPPGVPSTNDSLPEQPHLKKPQQTSSTQLGRGAIAPPADHTAGSNPAEQDLIYTDLPPFPADVPTAPLLRLSLRKLVEGDEAEEERLWRASCEVGFFYLDLRDADAEGAGKRDSKQDLLPGVSGDGGGEPKEGEVNGSALIQDAEKLFKLGEKVYELPVAEKQKYDFKDQGSYFGYKGLGAGVVDAQGTRDRNEFYNVSKDDLLGISERLPAPDVLQDEENRALLRRYMLRSHAIISLLLSVLNGKLGLPDGTLEDCHKLKAVSGDQVRWVRSPPQPPSDRGRALGEHTDFGSMTVLFNRLGGLQILPPGEGAEWCYVKPLKGHCVCNLGDAMVKFTRGVLRSNLHRVVNPPGEQAGETRMSLVYFARPEDDVVLKALEGSALVDGRKVSLVARIVVAFVGGVGWFWLTGDDVFRMIRTRRRSGSRRRSGLSAGRWAGVRMGTGSLRRGPRGRGARVGGDECRGSSVAYGYRKHCGNDCACEREFRPSLTQSDRLTTSLPPDASLICPRVIDELHCRAQPIRSLLRTLAGIAATVLLIQRPFVQTAFALLALELHGYAWSQRTMLTGTKDTGVGGCGEMPTRFPGATQPQTLSPAFPAPQRLSWTAQANVSVARAARRRAVSFIVVGGGDVVFWARKFPEEAAQSGDKGQCPR